MSESLEKVLEYLGEAPTKRAGTVPVRGKKTATKDAPSAKRTAAPVGALRAAKGPVGDTVGVRGRGAVRAPKLASSVVGRLADRLSVSQETVLIVSDIKPRTFHRRQEKRQELTEAESDRIMRIARVAEEAERVFGSSDKSKRWLSTENRILGARPLDLLATDAGARDVENELVRINHGDFA